MRSNRFASRPISDNDAPCVKPPVNEAGNATPPKRSSNRSTKAGWRRMKSELIVCGMNQPAQWKEWSD